MTALPTVPFGKHRITRLIGGHNPWCGCSHWSEKRSREMSDYHLGNSENAVAYLHHLVKSGIDTLLARGDYHRVLHWVELFRREGGEITWIAQTASEMHDVYQNIRVIAAAEPVAIYHHGTQTDRFWHEGRIDETEDYLKCIRDQGVLVGLAAHIPEVFDYVEDKGWDIDFYMPCFYNLSREKRQSELVAKPTAGSSAASDASDDDSMPSVDEEFVPGDPERICRFIQQTDKQCFAFKILAAGRKCADQAQVRKAFEFAYANIKPNDVVVVGMWQKYQDQIAANVEHALAAMGVA